MKKTLYIALGFTFWTIFVLPIGNAMLGVPWWVAFILGVCSGSATMMWWIVYRDEKKWENLRELNERFRR